METILIYPKSKEQVKVFEQMAKALKVPFEKIEKESPYDPEFVDKILQGDKDKEAGRYRIIKTEDLWK
ncbi:MAG: DUF2683 family protein [Ginsengibacter sp.]